MLKGEKGHKEYRKVWHQSVSELKLIKKVIDRFKINFLIHVGWKRKVQVAVQFQVFGPSQLRCRGTKSGVAAAGTDMSNAGVKLKVPSLTKKGLLNKRITKN